MSTKEKCPCCHGEGFILVSEKENVESKPCSECDGAGVVWCDECGGEGCEECDWDGTVDDCPKCNGSGTELKPVKHVDPPIETTLTTTDVAKLLFRKVFKKNKK